MKLPNQFITCCLAAVLSTTSVLAQLTDAEWKLVDPAQSLTHQANVDALTGDCMQKKLQGLTWYKKLTLKHKHQLVQCRDQSQFRLLEQHVFIKQSRHPYFDGALTDKPWQYFETLCAQHAVDINAENPLWYVGQLSVPARRVKTLVNLMNANSCGVQLKFERHKEFLQKIVNDCTVKFPHEPHIDNYLGFGDPDGGETLYNEEYHRWLYHRRNCQQFLSWASREQIHSSHT